MLPKNRRIAKNLFGKQRFGKRYDSLHISVQISKLENKEIPSKFSFSISKKVCKMAVERNKYRRQGYSVISRYIKKINTGFMCFFSFKKTLKGLTFEKLEKEVVDLLTTSHVLESNL